MQRIKPTDPEKASGRTRDQLEAVKRKHGRVPNLHATLANAPAAFTAYLSLQDALKHASLEPEVRERLAIAVAAAHDNEYGRSAHAAAGRAAGVPEDELARAQEADSSDPRVAAALRFAKAVVIKMGKVADEDVAELRAAGYNDAAALDIVALAAAAIFENYVEGVAQADVDFPRVPVIAATK